MNLLKTPSMRLDNKTALITGASRGIGYAAACALAEAGANLHLVARSGDALSRIQALLQQNYNITVHIHGLDITNTKACSSLFEKLETPIDILVNCAGINRPASIENITEDDYDAVMDLNIKAPLFITKLMVSKLREYYALEAKKYPTTPSKINSISGSIINISSQMGHVGGPERIVYCTSKHAIEGMSKSMALEFAKDNIRVNTLCPTFIETELTRPFFEDSSFKDFVKLNIPLGRIGQVKELMGAIVFLASDASSLMTGSALMLDGGWTAR